MAVTLHAHTMSAVLSGNRGAVGVGIADITFNDDYTMTITLTDGSTYTSGNLRGAQGIPGIDAEYDGEELVITEGNDTISDGGEVSTIRVKGETRVIRDRVTEEMALAEYPTREITGELIHLTDAAEAPLKSLSITLTPTQSGSGDPSPTNVRPISGVDSVVVSRTGRNLYPILIGADSFSNNGGGTHSDDDGVLVVTTTTNTSSGVYSAVSAGSGSECTRMSTAFVGETVTYSFEAKANTTVTALIGYARNGRVTASLTTSWQKFFSTVVFNGTVDPFTAYTNGTAATIQVRNLQIEFGSTATDYEPYQGDTYSVSLPQTVYSGVVDVTGGTVTVTHKFVSMKLSDATKREETANTNRYTLVNVFDSIGEVIDKTDGSGKTICNMLSTYAYNTADTPHFYVVDRNALLFLPKDIDETMTAQVLATLATPVVISLTPKEITTLLNENYIWSNSGVISLTYRQKFDVRLTEAIAKILPTETASGDIVSISDGAENIPVKALSVAVEPKQAGSGDPSPDNVRAITGWDAVNVVRCGKNIYPVVRNKTNSFGGVTFTASETGEITISGTATSQVNLGCLTGFSGFNTNDFTVTEGTYTVKAYGLTDGVSFIYGGASSVVPYKQLTASDNTGTFTVNATVKTGYNVLRIENGTTVNTTVKIQIERGSTATAYEPYQGTTYPIPLPSTVYGGTLDVASGVMTVDRAIITPNVYAKQSVNDNGIANYSFSVSSVGAADDSRRLESISNILPYGTNSISSETRPSFIIANAGTGYIRLRNSEVDTAEKANTWISNNGLYIVYCLNTKTTITLDPVTISTLLGKNTIYADAGQVSVCYRADVGLYIDKRIAEVQALVLES